MTHANERKLWMVAMALVAATGVLAVTLTLTRPEEVAERYLRRMRRIGYSHRSSVQTC